MKFGMTGSQANAQTNAGVKPDYGTFWVGPWTLKSGWGGPNSQMDDLRSKGITPAIHHYYWGDDISKSCLENGCWSSLHGTHKNKADWQKLTQQLVDNLNRKMGGKPVVIFLETEFNKADVQYYDPLDGYLKAKADFIKKNYPAAQIVLALGNWNPGGWHTWDRAASASDYVGLQGMRGSTRDSLSSYLYLYEDTLQGTKKVKSLFGKPVFLHDIVLSSYPDSTYKKHQADELRQFFTKLPDLKAAGVRAFIYRSWVDADMDTKNYYGEAERHWGLTYSWGSWKPAAKVWVDGVKAERSGSTTSSTSTSSGSFSASFTPSGSVNEWWVDVAVKSSHSIAKVEVKVNSGSWTSLQKNSWGTWSKSMHVPKGSSVVFKATDTSWQTATSQTYSWLGGTSSTSSGTSSTSSGYSATFSPSNSVNEWWVDVAVKATSTPSKVEVQVNGGSWTALQKNSWGTWSKSMHVPKGSSVVFKATDGSGNTATSQTYSWLGGTSSTSSGTSSTSSGYSATFSPSKNVNEWWVDVAVKATSTPSKVEVQVNGGSWTALQKNSWGTWSKSLHVPKGASVVFKATDGSGNTATSQTFSWLGSTSSSSSFSASFTAKTTNEWWAETKVTASESVSRVQVCVDGKGCTDLSKTSWGSWAKSTYIAKGSKVTFKATGSSGGTATSSVYTWG
ncbi:MAG: hypothetical protein KY455_03245 [Euryarchaeota archaeon]|nr:hypothetical protein [Euryarchaeota archaeon]